MKEVNTKLTYTNKNKRLLLDCDCDKNQKRVGGWGWGQRVWKQINVEKRRVSCMYFIADILLCYRSTAELIIIIVFGSFEFIGMLISERSQPRGTL